MHIWHVVPQYKRLVQKRPFPTVFPTVFQRLSHLSQQLPHHLHDLWHMLSSSGISSCREHIQTGQIFKEEISITVGQLLQSHTISCHALDDLVVDVCQVAHVVYLRRVRAITSVDRKCEHHYCCCCSAVYFKMVYIGVLIIVAGAVLSPCTLCAHCAACTGRLGVVLQCRCAMHAQESTHLTQCMQP
jgi:hypothetical protein